MTAHKYPQVLQWIAEGKFTNIFYRLVGGDELFRFSEENPHAIRTFMQNMWSECYVFELLPETMEINGHKVPEPGREELEKGTGFFTPSLFSAVGFSSFIWNPSSDVCKMLLKRGLIHLTEEAAIAHTIALLSFTEIDQ